MPRVSIRIGRSVIARVIRPLGALGVAAGLTACGGVSEKTFIEEYEPEFCSLYALCATEEMLRTVNTQECLQFLRQQDYPEPPECNYNPRLAADCLELLVGADCAANDPALPEICSEVYEGCRIPRVPPEDGFQQ